MPAQNQQIDSLWFRLSSLMGIVNIIVCEPLRRPRGPEGWNGKGGNVFDSGLSRVYVQPVLSPTFLIQLAGKASQ